MGRATFPTAVTYPRNLLEVVVAVTSSGPRPTRRPGATIATAWYLRTSGCFNPRPTRRPGATRGRCRFWTCRRCFNPRPTRRPGATHYVACLSAPDPVFQSSPDPKAGRNASSVQEGLFQSSPDPKAGRNSCP